MSTPLDAEIRGDWSNLKGTAYHLAYALWLLTTGMAKSVAFYRGNDLLATPTLPPVVSSPNASNYAIYATEAGEGSSDSWMDDWIQLKATQDAWTCSDLLDKALLANFICNALVSIEHKRQWRVTLLTQGVVRRSEVLQFIVAQPGEHPQLDKKLEAVIGEVQKRLRQAGQDPEDPVRLRTLAFDILRQLAAIEARSLETLTSQMRERLAYRFPDRLRVQQVERALIGALITDAAKGPEDAHDYGIRWLDDVIGEPFFTHRPFDDDPLVACDDAVQASIGEHPILWDAQRFAPRPALERELALFLDARETLFVLTGLSGTGKTWEMANWASRSLAGRARLFVPASILDTGLLRDLPALVASRLERFSSAYLSDTQMFARLKAASGRSGAGPLVVILDNLTPGNDAEGRRHALAQLLAQCQEHSAKLVVTCQPSAWGLLNLGRDIAQRDLYFAEQQRAREGESERATIHAVLTSSTVATMDSADMRRPSFALDDLSESEQEAILDRHLPPAQVHLVAPQLRSPAFAPLRRPYLLSLYLIQHGDELAAVDAAPEPVDVDTLLATHLGRLLSRVADALQCSLKEIEYAFDAAQEVIWERRALGAAPADVHPALERHLPGRGADVFAFFRRFGVLTIGGTVGIAEPLIEEWTFARMLRSRMSSGVDVAVDLRPETDSGTVASLLRSLDDPMPMAEKLLARDRHWRDAIATGLAQCSEQDYRVLALLSALARPQPLAVGTEGCVALGQLAARGGRSKRSDDRGRRAFEWAVQMYVSPHALERYRGARVLSATLDYAPDRVEAALRLRLSHVAAMSAGDSEARDTRRRWLVGALDPLLGMRSIVAAQLAGRVLERYSSLETIQNTSVAERDYRKSADEIRGLRAAFDNAELARITRDIQAVDTEVRFRAACALRMTSFEAPERIQDLLCSAITIEVEPRVLNRLLWASYRLSETAPDALLDAIQKSASGRWTLPSPTPGAALAALAETSAQRPGRVYEQLPMVNDLDAISISDRAILSEGFVYAWWTCAEYWPAARQCIQSLVQPDDMSIPTEFRVFALRGAAIAQFAAICVGTCSTADLRGLQMLYADADDRYVFLDLSEFARLNARTIVAHPDYPQLETLLLRCVSDEQAVSLPPFPANHPLIGARHLCASLCTDMLIALASALSDPLPTLRALPQSERALHATWRLLAIGRNDTGLVKYAEELCAAFEHGGAVTALEERERLLAELARLKVDPRVDLKERSRSMRHVRHGVPRGRAAAVAALTDGHPEELLTLVDDMLESPNDLPTLYEWEGQERSWQGLLVARVYARMFDERPIHVKEGWELCEQLLIAVRSLPTSPLRDEYMRVYETLALWLKGDVRVPPQLDDNLRGAIHDSHECSLELMRRAYEAHISGVSAAAEWELDAMAEQRGRGWWLAEHLRLRRETDSFSSGSGELVYVFPAVRLVLVAIGNANIPRDPASMFMEERAHVHETLAEYRHAQDLRWPMQERDLEKAITALQSETLHSRRHPDVCMAQAAVLRRLTRFYGAEATLRRCLAQMTRNPNTRASLLYDLACGYALTGRVDDCRYALEECAQLWPFRDARRAWLFDDPDLAIVRDTEWFKALGDDQ